ncbi:unnamed protein product [Acanthoscelides obtectus]|uniref:Uncharacterized protein n=1 Tax=Acanthoscelides obtectus TaxID=200917 RepID=A0A9P0P9R4_ACAOB|nr:unnamed protein product [Acanthoscelides obtectus]CAK1666642.1 hypothetical protein AOBTE_LOCUS25417 [Acanthoscelides obtectus]
MDGKRLCMHGQIIQEVEHHTVDSSLAWKWLTHANLKIETEALVTACQEQAIATNYMKAEIMKSGNDLKCRLCRTCNETIHHSALMEQHEEKVKKLSEECISESGVTKEAVEKAWNGEFDEGDDKLKEHMFCFAKKMGSMSEEGKINEEAVKKVLSELVKDEGEVSAIMDKCVAEKDSPKDTAFEMSKCIHLSILRAGADA